MKRDERKNKREKMVKTEKNTRKDEKSMEFIKKFAKDKGITLIALVVTILFSYDEMIKYSNSKGFLLATI